MTLTQLSKQEGISLANLSISRNGQMNAHFNKAVVYLAQTMFQLKNGGSSFRKRVKKAKTGVFIGLIREAVAVVDTHKMLQGMVTLSNSDLKQLVARVRKLPPYDKWSNKRSVQFNGI